MRNSTHIAFFHCMANIRRGIYLPHEIELLNKRVIDQALTDELQKCWGKNGKVPLVLSGNQLRMALNWQFISTMVQHLGLKPIIFVADINFQSSSTSQREICSLFSGRRTIRQEILRVFYPFCRVCQSDLHKTSLFKYAFQTELTALLSELTSLWVPCFMRLQVLESYAAWRVSNL